MCGWVVGGWVCGCVCVCVSGVGGGGGGGGGGGVGSRGGGAGRRGHGLPAELERIMAQVTSLITETRVEFVFAH